ncbi:MAG: ribosomal protein S18-alanine N-acetyltransferase [Chloroflexota bacterium]|nr:ribosomal protein S18-alanine N-acetyltransferase [Chloroflexota bacterium]
MLLADIPAVHAIERRSFSTPWPANAFEEELTRNRMAHYVVARVDGVIAGYAGLWMIVDEGHITTFSVDPSWRRRGIGQRMLLHLVDLSRRLGATRMTLEVRVSNVAAQALYAKFGFVETGRRRGYYSDDGEDALVMATPLLDDPVFGELIELRRTTVEGR